MQIVRFFANNILFFLGNLCQTIFAFLALYKPPTNVTVLHVTHDTAILRIPPPTQNKHDRRQLTLVEDRLLTHMRVRIQSSDSDVTNIFDATDDVVTLRHLRRLTYYNVTSSYGNGTVFGEPSSVVRFRTKGNRISPPSWHRTLFQRSYNVIWTLWTLDGHLNSVCQLVKLRCLHDI